MRFKSKSIMLSACMALAALFATSTPAHATLLLPGTTVVPTLCTPGVDCSAPGGAVIAATSADFTADTGAFSGHLDAFVYQNITGLLDFYYVVSNDPTSTDGIRRVSTQDFTGFFTDVAQGAGGGTVPAPTADRSLNARVIGFNFGLGDLLPGTTSFLLVIRTNATAYHAGLTSVIDGGVATVRTFAPVPEPGTIALLGSGLVGLVGAVRRRRNAL